MADMFSSFGNIFITRPREAESTDTRLGIRKHEPDQESRKKKDAKKEGGAAADDDSATVTVEALSVFLQNFLKSLETQKADGPSAQRVSDPSQKASSAQEPRQADGETSRAVGVYQHVASRVDRMSSPPVAEESQAPSILGAADIRTIHKLLEDLKPLSERGVEYLVIERSESFLGSLVAAVAKAKTL